MGKTYDELKERVAALEAERDRLAGIVDKAVEWQIAVDEFDRLDAELRATKPDLADGSPWVAKVHEKSDAELVCYRLQKDLLAAAQAAAGRVDK